MKHVIRLSLAIAVASCLACTERTVESFDNPHDPDSPAYVPPTPPAAPAHLAVTPGSGQNTISWDAVANATSYNLYWTSDGSNPLHGSGLEIAGATSPYVHTGLTLWITYRYVVTAVNGIGEGPGSVVASGPVVGSADVLLEFVTIASGSFRMGSTAGGPDEAPVHTVAISSFRMSKYEITQAQYQTVMGSDPSDFQGANRPVEFVSWSNAKAFCDRLSLGGVTVRLPTEAEWEYACRAGTTNEYYTGSVLSNDQANFGSSGTLDVGSYASNAWGLHDMLGNVCEWGQDWYSSSYYSISPGTNPPGPSSGTARVFRGGAWEGSDFTCRSAKRMAYPASARVNWVGFRVASPGP
jgi:formylglycine-generating enzyme required for sulfatase activity